MIRVKARFIPEDNEYFVFDNWSTDGSPIFTKEAYENFEFSYAHLYSNGEVNRYGNVIGKLSDIEFIRNEELQNNIDKEKWE